MDRRNDVYVRPVEGYPGLFQADPTTIGHAHVIEHDGMCFTVNQLGVSLTEVAEHDLGYWMSSSEVFNEVFRIAAEQTADNDNLSLTVLPYGFMNRVQIVISTIVVSDNPHVAVRSKELFTYKIDDCQYGMQVSSEAHLNAFISTITQVIQESISC